MLVPAVAAPPPPRGAGRPTKSRPGGRGLATGNTAGIFIAAGRSAGVRPGDLVGAIVNEAKVKPHDASMRRDRLFLTDILEADAAIAGFLAGRSREDFIGNDLVRSAILHKLTVIGEAAARISDELKTRHAEVPWSDIVGFRNIAVHAYFSVDWGIV